MVASNSTARSEAVLNYTFTKSDMGRKLVCLVEHVAYPTGSENSSVALDVLCKYSFVRLRRRLGLFDTVLADKPSVKIVRVDGGSVLEDGISSLSLSCISESNPPAQVGRSRFSKEPTLDNLEAGHVESQRTRSGLDAPIHRGQCLHFLLDASFTSSVDPSALAQVLEFKPITRGQAGPYLCSAENSVGRSNTEQTIVDVLYGPTIMSTEPRVQRSVTVHNRTVLRCHAEGNPGPKFQWLQRLPQEQVVKRGYESELVIEDAGYSDQGEYTCRAINNVGGERREATSEVIRLQVSGVPQVVKQV